MYRKYFPMAIKKLELNTTACNHSIPVLSLDAQCSDGKLWSSRWIHD